MASEVIPLQRTRELQRLTIITIGSGEIARVGRGGDLEAADSYETAVGAVLLHGTLHLDTCNAKSQYYSLHVL